jgi:hypothetical protein
LLREAHHRARIGAIRGSQLRMFIKIPCFPVEQHSLRHPISGIKFCWQNRAVLRWEREGVSGSLN